MRELLGFFTLLAIGFAGLYVAAFLFSLIRPFATHPITVTVFLSFVAVVALKLMFRSSK